MQRHRYSTHFPVHRYTQTLVFSVLTCRILATGFLQSHCNLRSQMKFSLHSQIHFLPIFSTTADCSIRLLCFCYSCRQRQSYFTTGGLPLISSSWSRAPWESRPEFFSLNWTPAVIHITSSCQRGWVYPLQLLLALASAFIFGSESCGTRDHILVSQISRLPFLSPPTTRRFTVEVFEPASTRNYSCPAEHFL
jgi:hypothetical protein